MRKLMLVLFATAALAIPAVASAHDPGHGSGHLDKTKSGIRFSAVQHGVQLGFFKHAGQKNWNATSGVFEKLAGTGSSFSSAASTASGTVSGRPLAGGTYSAAITTDWSKATDKKDGRSCAPATAALTLTDSSSPANSLAASVKGKTCSVGSNSLNIAYVFVGSSSVTGATGTLSTVTGGGRVLLVEKAGGTVSGFAFSGFRGIHEKEFASYTTKDAVHSCSGK